MLSGPAGRRPGAWHQRRAVCGSMASGSTAGAIVQSVDHTYTTLPPRIRADMKTKLTVTIDRDLLPKAKRYARARGVSLSEVIEANLRRLSADETKSFASRWRGKFVPVARTDERYVALAKKYL